MEVFGILFVLALLGCTLIGFITVLVWLAKFFSQTNNKPVSPTLAHSLPLAHSCAGCGASLQERDAFCMQCGLPRQTRAGSTEADLVATQRAVLRMYNLKLIDDALYQSLTQTIESEQARLRGGAVKLAEPERTPRAERPDSPARAEAITPNPATTTTLPMQPMPAPEPRRSLPEMLAAFMEESSIRWGELIGGLLIIGCSLALVISLWAEIAERPVLKFGIFFSLTAGLFGLGFYSAHRWKLPTTSRGVLLTATLLVPLNFLAVTAFGNTAISVLIVFLELAAWLLFGWLVFTGAKVYAAEHPRAVALGTMGAALALLLAKHFVPAGMHWRSWLVLGLLPVAALLASTGTALRAARASKTLEAHALYSLFAVLGAGAFAALLPLGLLCARSELTRQAWQEIAPLLALFGVPLLAAGWFGWRRLQTTQLALERTIITSIGLAGAVLLAGSTLLAFPFFDALLAVAALNAAVLGWAAWRYGSRAVRWLAFVQGLWGSFLLCHLALGHLSFGMRDATGVFNALTTTATAVILLLVFAALIALAERWRTHDEKQTDWRTDAELAATLCAVISFLLATYNGFGLPGDPQHLTWIYGFYALAAFALAWRRALPSLTWLGWGMLWLTSVQGCAYALRPLMDWVDGWAVASLLVAILAACAAGLSGFAQSLAWLGWRRSLSVAGVLATLAAALLSARLVSLTWPYLFAIAFVGTVFTLCARWREFPLAALTGGLLFNVAASLALLHRFAVSATDGDMLARLLQLNLGVSAGYALVWWWLARPTQSGKLRSVCGFHSRAVAAVWLCLLTVVAFRLTLAPPWASDFVQTIGDGWGWGLAVIVAAAYWAGRTGRRTGLSRVLLALLAFGTQSAATVHRWQHGGWEAFYVLLATAVLTAWVALALRWRKAKGAFALWTHALSAVAVVLALRAVNAPGGPWRSVAALCAIGALMLGLQIVQRSRAYAYAAGGLMCAALTMWIYGYATGGGTFMDVVLLNACAVTGIALVSLWIELRCLRSTDAARRFTTPAFHQFVATLLLAGFGLWFGCKLSADALANNYDMQLWSASGRFTGLALAALAALLISSLWDGWHRWRMAAFYPFGWLLIAALIDRRDLYGSQMLTCLSVVGALYALSAALLWRSRQTWASLWPALRWPVTEPHANAGLWWLTPANGLLVALSVLTALSLSFAHARFSQRATAAVISLCAPFALAWVIGQTQRFEYQCLSLLSGFGALLACGWLATSGYAPHQLVIFMALALTLSGAFLIGEALPLSPWPSVLARLHSWEQAVRLLVKAGALAGAAALLATLASEWLQTMAHGYVKAATWANVLTTIFFVALLTSLLGFALWRGRDPFNWQLTQRSRYVYAAEAVAVLLFLHMRLIAPWLFRGMFQAYWPFLILLLAFAGIALSELLRRRGRLVLADPLEHSGVFLPLLPSLAFSLMQSQVDYSGVLLGVALFYGLLSIMRNSFGFALLAVLSANGGWWHWLRRSGDFGFFAHPQVWLIPTALSLLLAAHLNRERLSAEQMTTLRYVALMTIYLSSTADIFLNGVAASPWLPLVLAVLSVAGVLMGMMLRVRAYLFLGTAFLLLAMITLVWHAAVSFGWRWLWSVAGIAFGILIIYLFAMFERHRAAWLWRLERFKSWQA